jgi:hypothetical protein
MSGSVMLDSYFSESDFQLNTIAANFLTVGNPTTFKPAKTIGQTMTMDFMTIASIESDLCKVTFDTVSRTDLPGSVAISGIKVYSKFQNKILQSYLLNYGYSTATSSNTYTQGYTTPLTRLKLNSLEEVPGDNGPHKFWQFAYNPLSLPSRKSFAQDYWGYYNGANSNTTMKPFVLNFNPDSYPFGNRQPDSASMMAEMLTKITYPTGGFSQFTFEPNGYPANEEKFTTIPKVLSLYLAPNQSNFTNTIATTFVITKPQYFKYQFTGIFSTSYVGDYGTGVTIATAVLTDASGATITQGALKNPPTGVTTVSLNPSSILIYPGTYTFTMSSVSSQTEFAGTQTASLNSSFNYVGSLGVQPINHMVGGVRVKTIAYSDNIDNTKSIVKNYTYQGANIAALIDTANDFVVQTTDNLYDCNSYPNNITSCGLPGCLATSVIFYERNASTKFGLGSIQGGTVGYSAVTESFGASGQGGKNVYNYSFVSDANIPASKGFPYPGIISYDYERGLLQEKDTYTATGQLVSKELNTYQFLNKNAITAYKVAYKFNILSSCWSYQFLGNLLSRQFYQEKTDQIQKTASTQIAYNTATGDSLVSTTNYYYDDTLNMQPIKTRSFNSRGDSVITYARTALEKAAINASIPLTASASLAIDTMVARNMVGIPVQSEKYIKNVLTDKVITNYRLQGNGFIQPDNVGVQNASYPLETRVQFNRYNPAGNLIEQQKVSDIKHVYLWDYSNTYPTAEVINADSANVAYSSFEADGSGNWSIGSTIRDTVTIAITGTKSYILSNGAVTKSGLGSGRYYRVSYWTRNAGSYSIAGTTAGYPVQGKTIAGWTYFEHRITGQTSVTLSGTGNIDELRLYPDSAQMTSYTYIPLIGVNSVCDINNRISYYKYDGFNRLSVVFDQDFNAIKKYCYSYNGQSISCTQFYNVAKSQTFTRNNCSPGYTPGTATYSVAAGKYASLISQADADQQAQNDINANGQNYANANGTCTLANVTITAVNNSALSGFTATFVNTSTSAQTIYNVPAGGGTLGTLPPGTYNVTIAKTGTVKYIYTVCTVSHAAAVSSTFSNMAISVSCSTIQIDTVN